MKNNTEKTRSLLEAALASCPPDFALSPARAHIAAALNQIHHVEGRRGRRQQVQTENLAAFPYLAPRYDLTAKQCQLAVRKLDKMIAQEQEKIEPDAAAVSTPGTDQDLLLS